jgi:hypothetical protein
MEVLYMNQDQVKTKLYQLDPDISDFTVTFSGKSSKKVDGLYYPDKKEIIIHNENFLSDNELIFTAIHEFTHHIQFERSTIPVSSRSHTNYFYNLFHKLLHSAEDMGIYVNPFKHEKVFIDLTAEIKEKFLSVNGKLMLEFGSYLSKAFKLCTEYNLSFEDYVDRELQLQHGQAKTILKIHAMDIDPEIGFENMKTVAKIKDPEIRLQAVEAFREEMSPDMIKSEFIAPKRPDNKLTYLMAERDRLELSIEKVTKQLAKIEKEIDDLQYE